MLRLPFEPSHGTCLLLRLDLDSAIRPRFLRHLGTEERSTSPRRLKVRCWCGGRCCRGIESQSLIPSQTPPARGSANKIGEAGRQKTVMNSPLESADGVIITSLATAMLRTSEQPPNTSCDAAGELAMVNACFNSKVERPVSENAPAMFNSTLVVGFRGWLRLSRGFVLVEFGLGLVAFIARFYAGVLVGLD